MNLMLYLRLFVSFLKIGITSFGGLSMIPLISEEMLLNGWMSPAEVSDIVAIAEMTPGPLGLNCATFAGMRAAGILGAVIANIGISVPSLTLTALAAYFFERFRNSRFISRSMTGIRPACMGLIFGVMLSLSLSNYFPNGSFSIPSLCIGLIDLLLLFRFKLSVPLVLAISAAAGGVCFHFLGL